MRTSHRVILAAIISTVGIYALIALTDPNRDQLFRLDNIIALNLTGIVAVLILVGIGALLVMWMNARKGPALAPIAGSPNKAPASKPARRRPSAAVAADPVIRDKPESIKPAPTLGDAKDWFAKLPTDQRRWIGVGGALLALLLVYLMLPRHSDVPAAAVPTAGIPQARTAPTGSPCDAFGTAQVGNVATNPQHCKELASTLHISETEMVRRFRIMFAEERCEMSVSTRQGQDECRVKYPFYW